MSKNRVFIGTGYAGNSKITATIDGVEYIIEAHELQDFVLNEILARGFTVEKTSRMKYPRLHIKPAEMQPAVFDEFEAGFVI